MPKLSNRNLSVTSHYRVRLTKLSISFFADFNQDGVNERKD